MEQAKLAHQGDGRVSELVQRRGQDNVVGREKGRAGRLSGCSL